MVARHVSLEELTISIIIAWLLLLGIIVYTYYHLRQCRKILSVPQQILAALSGSQDELQSSQRAAALQPAPPFGNPIKLNTTKIRRSRELGDVSSTVFSCLSSTFSSPPTSTAASFNGKPPAVFVPQLVFHLGSSRKVLSTLAAIQECRSDEEISLDTGRDSQTSTARQTVSIHHMSSAASHASLPAREIVLPDIVYGMLYDGYGYEYGNGVEGGDGYGHGYGHVNGQDDGDGDSDDDGDDDNSIDISSLPVQQDSL